MTRSAARPRIGWVVDAQFDFMRPEGRLYVKDPGDPNDPGADAAAGALERAVAWMREHCAFTVFTADWHGPEDEEIDAERPDFETTFPPHCMGRADDPDLRAGAEILESIRPEDPLVLPADASAGAAREAAEAAARAGRPVLIQKVKFCVFSGSAATEAFLEAAARALGGGGVEVVVCGVARDVCVKFAVEGLAERGHQPVVLRDAVWGLGLEGAEASFSRWGELGSVIELADLKARG